MPIRVILADDHNIIRQGLRALLEREGDIEIVGEADNGRDIVELCRRQPPDIVLMDIGMPGLNGIEATRQVLDSTGAASIKVIALSMHSDRRMAAGMLSAGASGYLLKDCVSDELMQAIRTVTSGRTYLSPSITETVVDDYLSRLLDEGQSSPFTVLTAREREVLQLMTEGDSTKEIASKLHVSVKTIETHRRQIMEKLDIHTVAELTKYAVREGLTTLE